MGINKSKIENKQIEELFVSQIQNVLSMLKYDSMVEKVKKVISGKYISFYNIF